jgi:MFS family permease
VSYFGTYVTALALQILIVVNLHASATEVGLVNAARWLPYLLFGLLAGVFVDRRRRLPILVGTDFGRAILLVVIPLLAAVGGLSVPVVIALMLPFGVLSILNDGAAQSVLPDLVTAVALGQANVRIQQSLSAAQTTGPGLGSPIELTYRQQVTPDHLQGRMNSTIRSFNWGMYGLGAPLGGLLADRIGYRPTLWIGIAGVAAMAVAIGCSRFRKASLADTLRV